MIFNSLNNPLSKEKASGRSLTISFIVSFCWHIGLFSIVYIAFPNLELKSGRNEVEFLGSYLSKYDFISLEEKTNAPKSKNIYFSVARDKAQTQDLGDFLKLENPPQKPKRYSFNQDNHTQGVYWPIIELFSSIEEPRGWSADLAGAEDLKISNFKYKKELSSFSKGDLPDFYIYFREGIPQPVKFKLLICERGRVQFLNKVISSGSFEADLLVARALRRLVFDDSRLGISHWRTFELDLENDNP